MNHCHQGLPQLDVVFMTSQTVRSRGPFSLPFLVSSVC
jgi:hypothetical protein